MEGEQGSKRIQNGIYRSLCLRNSSNPFKKLKEKSSRLASNWKQMRKTQSGKPSCRSSLKSSGILSDTRQCCWYLGILIYRSCKSLKLNWWLNCARFRICLIQSSRQLESSPGIAVPRRNLLLPLRTYNSWEVTPFSAALRGHLQEQLSTVSQPDQARLGLYCSYLITRQSLELSAHLAQSNNHRIEQSRSLFLPKTACQDLQAKPSQISFEEQLCNNADLWRKRDFRVSGRSNKGHQEFMFNEEYIFGIYVKLNKPG